MRIVWPKNVVATDAKRFKLPGVKMYLPCPGCGDEKCLDLSEGFEYPTLGGLESPNAVLHCEACEDADVELDPDCDPGYFSPSVMLRLEIVAADD
jgi:hypothetical protein